MMLSDADATSIDRSEQAILQTSWPAMRDALSRHLSAVSKKTTGRYFPKNLAQHERLV